ncbi:MAG: phosphatase PAP2 family protein [Streptosporangiaceae bacterium]
MGMAAEARAAAPSRLNWKFEALLCGVLLVMYEATRTLIASSPGPAFANAGRVLRIESALWIDWEYSVNAFVSARAWLAVPLCFAYASLHDITALAVLIWLWRRHPRRYAEARTALVVATLLGLLGFWLFPLAPPRMLPGYVDTMAMYSSYGWWGQAATSTPGGLAGVTNQFAAMPSLHVGWALWCGWQLVVLARLGWLRLVGLAYPAVVVLVVIGTANHWVLDVAAGVAVVLTGLWVARLTSRSAA